MASSLLIARCDAPPLGSGKSTPFDSCLSSLPCSPSGSSSTSSAPAMPFDPLSALYWAWSTSPGAKTRQSTGGESYWQDGGAKKRLRASQAVPRGDACPRASFAVSSSGGIPHAPVSLDEVATTNFFPLDNHLQPGVQAAGCCWAQQHSLRAHAEHQPSTQSQSAWMRTRAPQPHAAKRAAILLRGLCSQLTSSVGGSLPGIAAPFQCSSLEQPYPHQGQGHLCGAKRRYPELPSAQACADAGRQPGCVASWSVAAAQRSAPHPCAPRPQCHSAVSLAAPYAANPHAGSSHAGSWSVAAATLPSCQLLASLPTAGRLQQLPAQPRHSPLVSTAAVGLRLTRCAQASAQAQHHHLTIQQPLPQPSTDDVILSWACQLRLDEPSIARLALHCWRRVAAQLRVKTCMAADAAVAAAAGRGCAAATLPEGPIWPPRPRGYRPGTLRCCALACLSLGGKLEGTRRDVPSSAAIGALAGLPPQLLPALEVAVLGLLDWSPYCGFDFGFELQLEALGVAW